MKGLKIVVGVCPTCWDQGGGLCFDSGLCEGVCTCSRLLNAANSQRGKTWHELTIMMACLNEVVFTGSLLVQVVQVIS
jgi:hypothetical protein